MANENNVYGNVFQFGPGGGSGGEADYPDESKVRFGTIYAFGMKEGNSILPSDPQVLFGVGYGSLGIEFEGTLSEVPGGATDPLPPVMSNGYLRSPLFIGNSYLAVNGNGFLWHISPVAGMTIAGAAVTFKGWDQCDDECSDTPAWEITGTVTEVDATTWAVEFDMTVAETEVLSAGFYNWAVSIAENGSDITFANGVVEWACV